MQHQNSIASPFSQQENILDSHSGTTTSSVPPEVYEMGKLHFEGNVIPHTWYEHIRFDNGKVDLVSITLLSEIVYWYRPTYVKDEATGKAIGLKKKFRGDALQKSKKALADQFGFTERQVKDSLARLEELGLIIRDYRTIEVGDGLRLGNVLFIKINPTKIAQISFFERQGCDVQTSDPVHSNVGGHAFKRQTNTYTTTETSTKKTKTPPSPQGGEATDVACACEPSLKKKKKQVSFTPLTHAVCKAVKEKMFAAKSDYQPPNDLTSWLTSIEEMLVKDKRAPANIIAVLEWALADNEIRGDWNGWSSKLMTKNPAGYLRIKFDKIEQGMKAKKTRKFAPCSDDQKAADLIREGMRNSI